MPFEIVRNDITNMQVDAIVNTANPKPAIGYGVDAGIHHKAGPRLLEARKRVGSIRVGHVAITPGYNLPAKYVLHAVGPVWQGGNQNEEKLLRKCYERSLRLAKWCRCKSIAFPLMSAGNHGFPKDLALRIAMETISAFLMKNEMQVYLVVFSREAFQLSEKLFQGISSFIDENYIQEVTFQQYGVADKCQVREAQQQMTLETQLEMLKKAQEDRRNLLQETAVLEHDLYTIPEPNGLPDEKGITLDLSDLEEYKDASPLCSGGFAPTAVLPDWEEDDLSDDWDEPRPKMAAPSKKKSLPLPSISFPSPPAPAQRSKITDLRGLLKAQDAGFSQHLMDLIDQSGKKDSEIYNKANISRQLFSKIRKNPDYKPTKPTAVAFAIALELDLEQTKDLIGRAGYALTTSSKFDIIIMYFIGIHNYNIFDINSALFEFDQSLLGA